MYEAKKPKELKKLLEEGKTPIAIHDKDTIEVVKTMESLKRQGVVATLKQKTLSALTGCCVNNAIAETTIVALGIISAATLVALYAIYKNKNVKIKFNPDGSITIETSN